MPYRYYRAREAGLGCHTGIIGLYLEGGRARVSYRYCEMRLTLFILSEVMFIIIFWLFFMEFYSLLL